jgi:hypothetical protein
MFVKTMKWLAILIVMVSLVNMINVMILRPLLPEDNPAERLAETLSSYMPGNGMSGCTLIYYSYEYISCTITGIPGTKAVYLSVHEHSGKVSSLFVLLTDPVYVGDLKDLYGPYDLVVRKKAVEWRWPNLVVYKVLNSGRPTLQSQVNMLSWR